MNTLQQFNLGNSDYSKHRIQPWDIWDEYNLNGWDADIVKRVLRQKGDTDEERRANKLLDYKKIVHICQYLIAKMEGENGHATDRQS